MAPEGPARLERPAPGADDVTLEIGAPAGVGEERRPAEEARPFLHALSGMRFFPALDIVVGHVLICWWATTELAPTPNAFTRWCADGVTMLTANPIVLSMVQTASAALGCFFQLSGFVLAYIYLSDSAPTRLDLRKFFVARFARVYPTYALGLLFATYLFVVELRVAGPDSLSPGFTVLGVGGTVIADLLLLQAWWPPFSLAWNGPGWSLSCEAFFYLTFPLVVRGIDRLRPKGLIATVGLCWVASMLPPIVYMILSPDGLQEIVWTSDGFWLRALRYNPLLRLPEFVSGVALGKLWLLTHRREGLQGWGPWLSCGGTVVGLTLAALQLTIGLPYVLVFNGFFDLVCGAVVFGLALGGGPLHWLLSRRIVATLGDASYALYVLHVPAIAYVLRMFGPFGHPGFHPAVFLVVVLLSGAAFSVLVYEEFEVPMRRRVREWFGARPCRAPDGA